jgi:lambda family phage portal protein
MSSALNLAKLGEIAGRARAERRSAEDAKAEASIRWFHRPGQFVGARTDRQNTRGWTPDARSPNDDTVGDLMPLRARARDAVRNMALAASTVLTYEACVVGPGLILSPRIDREYLGLTDEQADAKEKEILRHYRAWSRSPWSSFTGSAALGAQQRLALTSMLVNGDHWIVKRRRQMPGMPYTLSLQHIEADLVSTPDAEGMNESVVDGVEFDRNGVAVAIHVANHYPHDATYTGVKTWTRIPIYSSDMERLVLHVRRVGRTNQARGVTLFSAGLEPLKALNDFADNELTAALNDSIFTGVFYSKKGTTLLPDMQPIDPETGQPITPDAMNAAPSTQVQAPPKVPLLSGGVINLDMDNEKLDKVESSRPSKQFAPFHEAWTKIYASAVGLPFELVVRHFTASFSASKGAINEGWRQIRIVRGDLIDTMTAPVYESFVDELAATGLVDMPGYFDDHLVRAAYIGHVWSGPVPGHLNPAQEALAAVTRMAAGMTTLEGETAEYNGSSWEENHPQSAKEQRWRVRDGLVAAIATALAGTVVPEPEDEGDTPLDENGDPITDPEDAR